MAKPFRRIVTGHDERGRAIIQSDAPPVRVRSIGANGPVFHEVWNTRETPAVIDRASGEPHEEGLILPPPKNGTRIRVLDIAPETAEMADITPEQARAHFAEIGMAEASSHAKQAAPHPYMHRTETIDYGIVLEGELTLIVDEGETVVRAGDIVVQRGTNHAWANRSGKPCRIAFILVDGRFRGRARVTGLDHSFGLNGKTARVTGATRGIGLAIAETLHAAGARVVVSSNEEDARRDGAARGRWHAGGRPPLRHARSKSIEKHGVAPSGRSFGRRHALRHRHRALTRRKTGTSRSQQQRS